MAEDEACQVCVQPHVEPCPVNLKFSLPFQVGMTFTRPNKVLRQNYMQNQVLNRYESDLQTMLGTCLSCRVQSRKFNHAPQTCSRRFSWIHAKNDAYQARKTEGKEWIERYVACWKCYQPQDLCRAADPDHEEVECRFPDMIMPLCYGVYHRPGGQEWLRKHFQQAFKTELAYMLWLGETASLSGTQCIQANCVAASALAEF